MPISEQQLETWSSQGAVAQSRATYATVRNALEDREAVYANRAYSIFLQGSYGNDTNIYADSDVDLVIMLERLHYLDLSQLSEEDKIAFERDRSPGDYGFTDFKRDVLAQLTRKFGHRVEAGRKAIFIPGNDNRRDCDVLACVELRRYTRYKDTQDNRFQRGICFWTNAGVQIINFPKQHSDNCTTKHQATDGWFKPVVRIVKNMRNRMIDADYLAEGIAPSYFLEGLIYNVPNENFAVNYQDTVARALNWVRTCDRELLVCANELYRLCHPTSPVTWRSEHLEAWLNAAIRFWNDS